MTKTKQNCKITVIMHLHQSSVHTTTDSDSCSK